MNFNRMDRATTRPSIKSASQTHRRGLLSILVRGVLWITAAPAALLTGVLTADAEAECAVAGETTRGTGSAAEAKGRCENGSLRRQASRLSNSSDERRTVSPDLADRLIRADSRGDDAGQESRALAHLVDGTWRRLKDGSLRLSRDLRALGHRDRLISAVYGRALESVDLQVKRTSVPSSYFAQQVGADGLPRVHPGFSDMNWWYLKEPGIHAAVRLLATYSRQALTASLRSGRLYARFSDMSEAQKTLALRVGPTLGRTIPSEGDGVEEDWREWLTRFGLVYHCHVGPEDGSLDLSVRCGDTNRPIWVSRRAPVPVRPRPLLAVRGNPNSERSGESAAQKQVTARSYAELEARPFPARKFVFRWFSNWEDLAEQLANCLPYRFCSEDLPASYVGFDTSRIDPLGPEQRDLPKAPDLAKMSMAEGLDALCALHSRVWWRSGDALFFRHRAWYLNEALVAPEEEVKKLETEVQEAGKLSQAGLLTLSRMTVSQLEGLSLEAQAKSMKGGPGRLACETLSAWLQLFSGLTARQQQVALTEEGLAVEQMPGNLRQRLQESLYVLGARSEAILNPGFLRLRSYPIQTSYREGRVIVVRAETGWMLFSAPMPNSRK